MRARVAVGWIEPEPAEEAESRRELAEDGRGVRRGRRGGRGRRSKSGEERRLSLAAAARERRDIVSGEVMDEARLIRFVAGPGRRRGAGPGAQAAGARPVGRGRPRGGRDGGAQGPLRPRRQGPAEAPRRPRRPGRKPAARAAAGRRWALRARPAILPSASRRCSAAIAAGKAAWLIEASDGAADGRRKLLAAARRSAHPPPRFWPCSRSAELGLALGARECDTHRLPCGAGRRALDSRCRAAGGLPSAPSLRVGARSPRRGRARRSAPAAVGYF